MSDLLWVIVLTPFASALILALFGASMPKKLAGAVGCASIGVSWIAALVVLTAFARDSGTVLRSSSVGWIDVAWFQARLGLTVDHLSLIWLVVITSVGLLIHLYAAQSMYDEDGYSRFFCYMNLFVGSMLTLVLADNLLLLYLGWEGVGLCSYLLIGFWYKERANCDAARKAFIVTRIGDTALAIGLFVLATHCGSLDIESIRHCAPGAWTALVCALVLGGAVGKSAQLPLQTWLPDAMAGPTPVSALIHAATMVTAGVYLIDRLGPLFALAPPLMLAVAVVGAVTLLYAGITALTQRDIKRVLAYSTMSQIGYMFLALGVGAWGAAAFHFFTHAFFKALLFLSAGVVIDAQRHEHDIFKMGGLRRALPIAFWTFLIGAASLSALPLVTAGFYSKEAILSSVHGSPSGSAWLLVAGLVGSLITAAYSFRVVFLVFFGEQKMEVSKLPGGLMRFSLIVLSFFSIVAGFVDPRLDMSHGAERALIVISTALVALGVYAAYVYFTKPRLSEAVARSSLSSALHAFFFSGWRFDWLYEHAFVIPLKKLAYANSADFIDAFFTGLARVAKSGGDALALLQTGRVRTYTAALVFGAVVVTALILWR